MQNDTAQYSIVPKIGVVDVEWDRIVRKDNTNYHEMRRNVLHSELHLDSCIGHIYDFRLA